MRSIGILGATILAAMTFVGIARGQDKPPASGQWPGTFAIETYVGRAYNYLDRMVDKDGLPYFNIFWSMTRLFMWGLLKRSKGFFS